MLTPAVRWLTHVESYDGGGERVRKVIETQNAVRQKERLYLGGFEIYREYSGAALSLERESLHVMDDVQRIALVETQIIENGNTVTGPVPLQRYQFGNHCEERTLPDGTRFTQPAPLTWGVCDKAFVQCMAKPGG